MPRVSLYLHRHNDKMFNPRQTQKKAQDDGQKMGREVSSGIIIFRKFLGEPQFLILYYGRSQWTFPRGKIEKEERSFAAALRETKEETGFVKSDLRFVDYFKAYENWTFEKNNRKVYKTVIFYLAETSRKSVRIEERSQGYGWFTYREALKVFAGPKNSENRKVLKRAYDFLTRKKHGAVKPVETSGQA